MCVCSGSIGRNARSGSAPRDFEHGRVALVCSASCASLMSILQSVGGPRSLLSNAMAFSRAYAGGCSASCLFERFLAALCSQRSAGQPRSKGSRYGLSVAQAGGANTPWRRGIATWRGALATRPPIPVRLLFMQPPLRLPLPPRVTRRPFDHAESDSEVNHARLCVMRHASCVMRSCAHALMRSCAHPLMRWRHCGVRGWRGLSGQKIAWALIWFVEASRLHGGKRLRPTAHGARPPLAWPPCNPTGPRHFG